MHVIVLTSAGSMSGGVRQALYLACGLQTAGHSVHFVCPGRSELSAIARSMGLAPIRLPWKLSDINTCLRALMPEGEPVIIHGFHNRGVKLTSYLCTYWRILGLPVAGVAHRGVTSRPGNPLPYLLPGIRAYLVNSMACAAILPLLWRRRRCHVVNNAIPPERLIPAHSAQDMRALLNIPDDHLVIGNISNDNPLKGVGRLLRTFARTRASMAPSVLIVVGVTPEIWEPLCQELGISEWVRLIPKTNQVADYLQLMTLLVFPSSFIESQPNVIIEAMSMGVPVVAGDVGGVRDLLPAECLVDPENEQELGEKMIAFVNDPDRLRHLSAIGEAKRPLFSIEHRLETVLGLYQSVLDEVSGHGPSRAKPA